ncbi:MAG: hypothetical protein K6G88_03770 [Lachnospiraceae bacterium]|nr:hypothetical protein [Lachnospiraceae bacterium]
MGNYGVHPTQYEKLSNSNLYSMYRESVYSKLTENEKLDLLQETVNRDAVSRGELGAPEVKFAHLPANESGNASNGVIRVNYDMAVKGIQSVEYKGQTIERQMDDYNIQTLNTVLHEDSHCFQDQVIDGTVSIDDARLTAEYKANAFSYTAILQNGNYQLGSQYMTGETPAGYYMYYFQATERDAYLYAENKTNEILKEISSKNGFEPSFEAYSKSMVANGYAVMEKEAIEHFQNPNFVKDVNNTLVNQYYGTNIPVNPMTEEAVKNEMVQTYKSLNMQMDQGSYLSVKEEESMSFDYKPVTLEEYNQTLRDSVNGFYSHSINNPSVSNGQALSETSEMAENYHAAVEQFQNDMGMSGTENEIAVDTQSEDMSTDNASLEDLGSDGLSSDDEMSL